MKVNWHVLGAGAIGCLFAAKLQRGGCSCTLLLKDNSSRTNKAGNSLAISVTAQDEVSEICLPASFSADRSYIEHLIITTKAYDALPALAAIAHRLDAQSHILLLINGMGVLEQLEIQFPHLRFYCGTTTEGAYRTADNAIVHAGSGTTKIGRSGVMDPPEWFGVWTRSALDCLWERDIAKAMWRKLTINCAINPLTALHGCNNGDLLSSENLAGQLLSLCEEITAISAAAGQPRSATDFHTEIVRVINGTASNRSSMLQDISAQRPTEIEFILGYLVDVANRVAAPAPISKSLLLGIRQLEHRLKD